MCYKSSILIIFFILKLLILVIVPIVLFVLYRLKNKVFNLIGGLDILFIIILIILRLTSNTCITNSNVSYIKNNINRTVVGENINTLYESIYSTETYLNKESKNAYFYGINYEPLKNVKISCDKKSYIKNYGDSITAITILISNYYGTEINEVDVISFLEENKLIDCKNGIDFDTAFIKLKEKYYYNIIKISSSQVRDYISKGNSVLVETINKSNEDKNFGCEKDYIVIYNNNDDEYNIINPNDKSYSYFCSSNTIGYGSIIEEDQNNKSFTLEEIDSKALRYYTIEVTQ